MDKIFVNRSLSVDNRKMKEKIKLWIAIFLIVFSFFQFDIYFKKNFSEKNLIKPQGVRLIPAGNLNDSISIMWYTETKAKDPQVEYSLNSDLSCSKTQEPELNIVNETHIYKVELNGLTPNSTYYYQISSDSRHEREVMYFKTLPNDIKELKIIIISDSHTSDFSENNKFFFDIINTNYNFDFYFHLGDIVRSGRHQDYWNSYFRFTEQINAYKIGFYVEGNHDGKETLLIYDNILTDSSYDYNFENLLFLLGLNTQGDRESTWEYIDEKLNKTRSTWKIGIFHKHVFSSRRRREDSELEWVKYFKKYKVNAVFHGHNHHYDRLYVNQTYYFQCPSCGEYRTKEKDLKHNKYSQLKKSIFGFMMLEVTENLLHIEVYGHDGEKKNFCKQDEIFIV